MRICPFCNAEITENKRKACPVCGQDLTGVGRVDTEIGFEFEEGDKEPGRGLKVRFLPIFALVIVLILVGLYFALQSREKSPLYHSKQGYDKLKEKDYNGAIASLDKALKKDPVNSTAYINRGIAKRMKKDLKGAIEDFSWAIEVNPKNAKAYYNRGAVKVMQGDERGAIKDYNAAIKLNPGYFLAYLGRGRARTRTGDYKGSMADLDQALKIKPKYWKAWADRAVTCCLQGHENEFRRSVTMARKYSGRGDAVENKIRGICARLKKKR